MIRSKLTVRGTLSLDDLSIVTRARSYLRSIMMVTRTDPSLITSVLDFLSRTLAFCKKVLYTGYGPDIVSTTIDRLQKASRGSLGHVNQKVKP